MKGFHNGLLSDTSGVRCVFWVVYRSGGYICLALKALAGVRLSGFEAAEAATKILFLGPESIGYPGIGDTLNVACEVVAICACVRFLLPTLSFLRI